MAQTFDVIVVGAGHNALTAAAYLAKAGRRCAVLEANEHIGGDTSTLELTRPGFLHDPCSTSHASFMESPAWRDRELPLAEYGLEYIHSDPAMHLVYEDGSHLTQWTDLDRTCAEFAKFSRRDADAYRRMMQDWQRVAPLVRRERNTPIGHGPTLQELLTELPDGGVWTRREAMSAWDIVLGNFEDEHTRVFMLWMAFNTMQPVERPGTGVLAYSTAAGRQRNGWAVPRGGSAALPRALARYIESRGGVVLTSHPVAGLVLEGGRCVGVETEAGEQFRAREAVVSNIHVKHLIEMAPPETWGESFTYAVDNWAPGVGLFVSHHATTEAPCFQGTDGRLESVAAGLAPSLERFRRIVPDYESGEIVPGDREILVLTPTVADPSRAPEGMHTLKMTTHLPYALRQGPQHWDALKDAVAAQNLRQLQRFAPNLTDDKVLATTVMSPIDLERYNRHNWHGSCHGGDLAPAQARAMRPAPGWAAHRMPIPGLYQTGSTTHPGGSVTGAAGRNAAMVLLGDIGADADAVFASAEPVRA